MEEENGLVDFCQMLGGKLVEAMSKGDSFLQKIYDGRKQEYVFTARSAFSGENLHALNAVVLSLAGYGDPRWVSADEALHAGLTLKAGEKGTVADVSDDAIDFAIKPIDFPVFHGPPGDVISISEREKKFKPGLVFNASQFIEFPMPLISARKYQAKRQIYPFEFVERMMDNSNACLNHGVGRVDFDYERDEILIPEKDLFQSERQFFHYMIKMLVKWTGHSSRLNRPEPGASGLYSAIKEELLCAIAGRLLGESLMIGYNDPWPGHSLECYLNLFRQEPMEIWRVCLEAQKAVSILEAYLNDRDMRRDHHLDEGLQPGEVIHYRGTIYHVLKAENQRAEIQKLDTGQRARICSTDGIYKSLVEARKNNPRSAEFAHEQEESLRNRQGRKR